ncbi:saccharopine dehydrogenase-like protein [Rhodococcus sp. SMB37]|uniref:saccharopine dehydrogenase NADP-binding domain-containing protein n=1 Tax=Rhodococcus sp. SMB37 TaxID=2512213 RepID=UPI0010474F12|nr:saccharopine dehydrogenase NADP-binding domain-containing protein [Rhodococcus sp. SMB37]TCN50895.1 saccharopine dehydrogenase-like protein [Rhodococcus sp. SMB37]
MSGGDAVPVIGLIGGSGTVGRTAALRMSAAGLGSLRIGGRNLDAAAAVAAECVGEAEPVRLDLADEANLEEFCCGCSIVVNCAGPSYLVLDSVARTAFSVGADYIDIGGELPAADALRAADTARDRTAIFSAGAMPGLSGLLPRLIAQDRPLRRLETYVGGVARFTELSAADGLLTRGERFGESMASMRDGMIDSNSVSPLRDVSIPGFPRPVHAWPYLTTEAQSLGGLPGVAEVRAYNVFASDRLTRAMTHAWAQLSESPDHAELAPFIPSIVDATIADEDEFGSFYVMLFTGRPAPGHPRGVTRVVLRAEDSYGLSGSVVALAAEHILVGRVSPGVHLAAEALDPCYAVKWLREDPLVHELVVA